MSPKRNLILSQKPGETVFLTVGDVEIEILCLEFHRGQVRLSFKAPDSVRILREKFVVKDGEQ